uniref:PPE family protein, SVP subgroup n=1 Tax=Mycobacterium sp. HUMS_1102779 TaxID=3383487 RepID=UPI003899C4FE
MQQSYLSALGGTGGAGPASALRAFDPVPPGALGSGIRAVGSAVSTDVGHAGVIGNLSVPQGWASAAPAIRPVATVLPQNGFGAVPARRGARRGRADGV